MNANEIWYCGNDIEIDIAGAYEAGLFPVLYDARSVPSSVHEKNDGFQADFSFLIINDWNELPKAIPYKNNMIKWWN